MYCKSIISKNKKVYTNFFTIKVNIKLNAKHIKNQVENVQKNKYYKNFTKIKNICKKTLDLKFFICYYSNCTEEIS